MTKEEEIVQLEYQLTGDMRMDLDLKDQIYSLGQNVQDGSTLLMILSMWLVACGLWNVKHIASYHYLIFKL